MPLLAGFVHGIKDVGAGDFAFGAIASHDLVATVTIEVPHADLVTLGESVVDDVALPAARAVLGVNDDLIAVPRLDRRKEAPVAEVSDADITRAETRRVLRIVALNNQLVLPL